MEPFSEVFDDIAAWVRAPLGLNHASNPPASGRISWMPCRLAGRVRLPQGATAALDAF
jgi:hypothetical protein